MRQVFILLFSVVFFAGCVSSIKTESSGGTNTTKTTTHNLAGRRVGDPATMIFHTEDCPAIVGLNHAITFPTRADAIASGFKPDESGQCDP